ncbi:MAG: SPFH domain-containing protein [Oscillospiraceae bacterium]|nr:SPFH domain-containing protein [Oscillospiraceae bacterium]
MGLIKAAFGAAGGVLADQWKEYFYCDSLPENVLMAKGEKRTGKRSSNTKGSDNVISNGSVIAVADGQAMIIVDSGRIAEFCAEPGEFTYDTSAEPSIFSGKLGESIKASFATFGRRFTFGGDVGRDQRVYYFNTKEIMGNKYGTPAPVPFRVVDNNIGLDMEAGLRCNGEYTYRITDPILFYKTLAGNVSGNYTRDMLDSQMKSQFLTCLQPAFAKISEMGIRYSALPGHTLEISEAMDDALTKKWSGDRGISIVSVSVNSVTIAPEDEATIKELQKTAVFRNANMAGAYMVGAQGEAMKTAAANPNGAMMGFMGMGMAQQAGGMNAAQLFQIGQQQTAQQQAQQLIDAQAKAIEQVAADVAVNRWTCACGATATGKFCPECGAKKPEPKPANGWKCACGATATGKFCPECGAKKPEDNGWKCACGATVTGKFCPECGSPKPADDGSWTCSCGQKNTGKFCPNCGGKKPAGVPQYRCDKCGWQPADPTKAPRFCPECGDPFDNGDIV